MQLDMSETIRLGSPDDGSNNMDTDLYLAGISQAGNTADSFKAETAISWANFQDLQHLTGTIIPSVCFKIVFSLIKFGSLINLTLAILNIIKFKNHLVYYTTHYYNKRQENQPPSIYLIMYSTLLKTKFT